MLDALRRLLQRPAPPGGAREETDGPAAAPPSRAEEIRLAAAALLVDLAQADGEFSAEERSYIEGALERHFGLASDTAAELIDLAHEASRRSVDHYQFTRVLTEHYDLGQKMLLAEVMWGVILADGTVGKHETYLVRRLAHLLDLEPAYLSQARKTAAEKREE